MKIINLIKEIGFVENNQLISNYTSYWVYNKWIISIHNYTIENGWEKRWSLQTSDGRFNLDLNFAMDDIKPLHQYFKSELREIKLNEIGV